MSLTIADYKTAAEKLGVEVASIRAVASIESSGKGFFNNGSPVILYERHIFYKELLTKKNALAKNAIKAANPTVIGAQLDQLIATALKNVKNEIDGYVAKLPNICNSATGGYLGGIKEYDRLALAKNIDEECALRSCSWGAFQLMGFHAEFLGFKDVFEFVEYIKASEANQLLAFCTFILKNPALLNAMRQRNWAQFARLYNGPGYTKFKYDTKMASAFNLYTNNPNLA